jgi:hypothetical protein
MASEHETEHASRDAQGRAEDDPDIPHRHLVHVRVLHDADQMCRERTEQAVVGDGQLGDQLRQFPDSLRCIREVCIKSQK